VLTYRRDFGFGLPALPYLAGRDIVGVVMRNSRSSGRIKRGDVVLTASTDYRDLRKAAFQSYAIAPSYNVCRISPSTERHSVAGLGVAFVAALLILGACLGVDFSQSGPVGPNLREILRGINVEAIPEDVRDECLNGISDWERPQKGDWIVIWGGKLS
jgi:NADPH:quinone reductase-like Zn-dependent oxidoreductase